MLNLLKGFLIAPSLLGFILLVSHHSLPIPLSWQDPPSRLTFEFYLTLCYKTDITTIQYILTSPEVVNSRHAATVSLPTRRKPTAGSGNLATKVIGDIEAEWDGRDE